MNGLKIGIVEYRKKHPNWRQIHSRTMKGKMDGPKNPAWKGGIQMSDGYVRLYAPYHPKTKHKKRKWMYEHILVAEMKLRRDLRSDEVVHHLNGIKTDNRAENLEVTTRSKHIRIHRVHLKDAKRRKNNGIVQKS